MRKRSDEEDAVANFALVGDTLVTIDSGSSSPRTPGMGSSVGVPDKHVHMEIEDEMATEVKFASSALHEDTAPTEIDLTEKESEAQVNATCHICKRAETGNSSNLLRVCAQCQLTVHHNCYIDPYLKASQDENKEKQDQSSWKCDTCLHGVDTGSTKCVYCDQSGGIIKLVDLQYLRLVKDDDNDECAEGIHEATATTIPQFGHLLCIKWDPRRLRAITVMPKEDETMDNREEDDVKIPESADTWSYYDDTWGLPSECCFCHASSGIRIRCRRVNCCRFFHAQCAHQRNGHLEMQSSPFFQFHAFCDRHSSTTDSVSDLLDKMVSKQMTAYIGRDGTNKLQTIKRRLDSYNDIDKLLHEISIVLVELCNKSLKASKTDPPVYNSKCLQALQFFLDYVPQLQTMCPSAHPQAAIALVGDRNLHQQLLKTFNPAKYLGKYPGPISQQHSCDVCAQPFHVRQHLFYCSNDTTPHLQHWKCTKRRSNARERDKLAGVTGSSTKKKLKAITTVQNGVWKDIKLPKGLPSVTDGIICGVCRNVVDAHGLIASRKEAKRSDFEKKQSIFVQNGCFVNLLDSKFNNIRSTRPTSVNSRTSGVATKAAESRSGKRSSSSAPENGKSSGNTNGSDLNTSTPVLMPQKMERINVQRTARWLACVGQIIRLAGVNPAASKAANVIEDKHDEPSAEGQDIAPPTLQNKSLLSDAMNTYFEEAIRIVKPFDPYALDKIQSAREMLRNRSGPAVPILRALAQEYTRFIYTKHTRAVEKVAAGKRKREEQEAQEQRELERKRVDREAELALKSQMLAMRKNQRKNLKQTL